jgi:hypothetical protein
MAAYSATSDIWFNLSVLVKDNYQLRSDALERTRRGLNALERRERKCQERFSLYHHVEQVTTSLDRWMDHSWRQEYLTHYRG